jgi:signal transduction histidine kinase/CheY-like chemotaxis protein
MKLEDSLPERCTTLPPGLCSLPMGGGGENWRTHVLHAAMVWTARLGGVIAAVLVLTVLLRSPTRLREPGIVLMLASYAGLVALRHAPSVPYRLRAIGFCSLCFSTGVAALSSLGVLPGPTLVCAFVVITARLFLGTPAMIVSLVLTTAAVVLADLPRSALPGWEEQLGVWFWVREATGYSMATASIAMVVAHVVTKIEQSSLATAEALRRSSAAEADRERAREALLETEQALLRSQKLEAVGRLAAGVGHDFNNTLQVMLSWTSLLRDEPDEHDLAEGLDAIEKAALQGRELTQRLLAFGRRDVRARTRASPAALVHDSARALRRLLPEDIAIELDVDPDAPDLLVDPDQLAHVLLNLGVNARDAMPAGGVLRFCVTVLATHDVPDSAAAAIAARELVRLSVQDSGTGMDAETLAHLFEPFYTTKGERGTGLGLATAYSLVQRNGGFVRVESQPGKGSSFHLHFPAQLPGAAAPEPAPPPLRHRDEGVVMLAEDDPDVRGTMARALRSAGYRVIESADAVSAIAQLDQHGSAVDVLCTDGIMPGGGTGRLIEHYLACRPSGQVIVCSGYVQEELLRRDLDAGAYAYLPKPFHTNELLDRIAQLMDLAAPQHPA